MTRIKDMMAIMHQGAETFYIANTSLNSGLSDYKSNLNQISINF